MDALQMAHEALDNSYGDINAEQTIAFAAQAQAYAAIAQAEQLKRIADWLDDVKYISVDGPALRVHHERE